MLKKEKQDKNPDILKSLKEHKIPDNIKDKI